MASEACEGSHITVIIITIFRNECHNIIIIIILSNHHLLSMDGEECEDCHCHHHCHNINEYHNKIITIFPAWTVRSARTAIVIIIVII